MGTRGAWSVRIDGTTKTQYVHWDSYPSGLGADILGWLRQTDRDKLAEQARALRVVDSDTTPTADETERYWEYVKHSYKPGGQDFGEQPDWYDLLYDTHADPALTLNVGVVEDGSHYGGVLYEYVIDLDTGRFSASYELGASYSWSLDALPSDGELIAALGGD
jgi:hypothetical protein